MAVEVQSPSEQGLGPLLKGIVGDMGDLLKHQLQFAQAEIKSDLKKTGAASGLLVCGIATIALGGVVLAFMLVHLLHWLTMPAAAVPPGLPLWACHAIVGFLILATGAALAVAGKKKFDSFNPLPDETAKTVKENLQWMTSSK